MIGGDFWVDIFCIVGDYWFIVDVCGVVLSKDGVGNCFLVFDSFMWLVILLVVSVDVC